MLGRCTLTATCRPSSSVPLYTCPIQHHLQTLHLRHEHEHLADELLIHEGRVVELEPLGAEPLGEVLLGEKELEQHAHLEVLLREQQRLEARKAELLQPQQRKVAEHEVGRSFHI